MAVSWYTDAASGSNTNGGSSEGSAKNSGTAAATTASNATVVLLVDNPNMSTVAVGDAIRLNGRTDGIRSTDVFEITAFDNGVGVKTVTVTPTPGTTTSGVTWAIGGALATLTRAALLVRSGEQVNVKTGTYNEALTISQAGANNAPVKWFAYVSSPNDIFTTNDAKAIIDGQATRANGIIAISGTNHNVFKNFTITGHTSRGLSAASGDYLTFKRCWFSANNSDGALCDDNCMFESCTFNENGANGLDVNGNVVCVGCVSDLNGTNGFRAEGGTFYKCIASSNEGDGFVTQLNTTHCFFECIVYGNNFATATAFNISNAQANSNIAIVNCAAQSVDTGFQAFSGFSERAISHALGVYDIGTDPFLDCNEWGNRLVEDPFDWVDPGNIDFTPDSSSNLTGAGYGPEVDSTLTSSGGTLPTVGPILPDYSGLYGGSGNGRRFGILTGGNL